MSDMFTQEVVVGIGQPETPQINIFNFHGTSVRVVKDESGEPWFVAKDVCDALEIRSDTVRVVLEEDEIIEINPNTIGIQGGRSPLAVSESGLYSLTLRSRKPEAKAFKRWVTHEVLPAIRRDGGYIAAKPEETLEELSLRTINALNAALDRQKKQLEEARATIAQKDEKLELAAPKVAFVETFATSTTGNILVRDFAGMVSKSLGVKGFGQTAMFEWLKDNGYMNLNRYPSQKAKDMKLLESTEGFHVHHDGTTGVHHCTRITPKGQTYFFEKIKAQYDAQGRWW